MPSWSSFEWTTTGKVPHCSKFAPFVDNGSHCCSLKSRILKNAFVTFSRLIDANEFASLLDSFETF